MPDFQTIKISFGYTRRELVDGGAPEYRYTNNFVANSKRFAKILCLRCFDLEGTSRAIIQRVNDGDGMPATASGRLSLIVGNAPRSQIAQNELADALWGRLRLEAREAYRQAPMLAPLFVDSILNQPSFEAAIFHRIATRLHNNIVGLGVMVDAFNRAVDVEPDIANALRADIAAVVDRDPACVRFIEPFLYFKGFHAIQTHRLANWLWRSGERDFALYLQSRSSDVFQTDIHPAVKIGRGVFLDHATGLVVGETAVIEDNVSMLQGVTLGGTGKESGDRHPKIRQGAMIGAGAKVLGNIEVGANARVAAGSIVLRSVEANTTVAGVPARAVRTGGEASETLEQILIGAYDYSI